MLCFYVPGKAQSFNDLQVDFAVYGFPDNATNVTFNPGTTYTFKSLVYWVCTYNLYSWYVTPVSGGSTSGIFINGQNYNSLTGSTAPSFYEPTIRITIPGTYSVGHRVVRRH